MIEILRDYKALVHQKAQKFDIDDLLILAIVWHESRAKTFSFRYEPGFTYRYTPSVFATNLMISLESETMAQMTSWGLMHVMGCRARELGHDSYLTELCVPDVGLELGAKNLNKLASKYSSTNDVIAAYNAGTPIVIGGRYRNQKYVDDVNQAMADIKKARII